MTWNDERFNRVFSACILIGMTAALVFITLYKLRDPWAARALLLISAFGSLCGVAATVLSANGNILTFLFGLLDVSIYGAICFVNWRRGNPGLGNALLHFLYFVPMQFVGFFQWRSRSGSKDGKVRARRLSPKQWALYMSAFLLICLSGYFFIARFDKSAADTFIRWAVVLDVLPLACNILGQLLMSTAYMEQWVFWIGVNITSICMWSATLAAEPGSSYALVYILKYSFYLLNSINGLRIWMRLSSKK